MADCNTDTSLLPSTHTYTLDAAHELEECDRQQQRPDFNAAYTLADVEAAARAAAEVPLELSRYDPRPRWCAVSLAHPVEYARFRDDARVKFYFRDNDDDEAAVMRSDDYCWWITPEPRHKRETRLRQIFGAYVCGDSLPWMEPFTAEAYADASAHPVREMTAAITECLQSVVDDTITSVPAELREPEYVRVEREQAETQSKSRKRGGSD